MSSIVDDVIANQREMFGCTQTELDELIAGQHDKLMLVASILSDAQHINDSDPEANRKLINKAKYILFQLKNKYQPG